ncbi:MAG: hypothetical protein CL797_01935 [Chromatiales bacterium]|nr:hypothetical protein [Chromatiales bacterium]
MCLIGLVLYMTLMPDVPGPTLLNDKLAHGIAFMALMVWFSGIIEMRFAPLVAVALLCLGVLIELAQQQLSYRSAELADGLADMAGIVAGWSLAVIRLQHWAKWIESLIATDHS